MAKATYENIIKLCSGVKLYVQEHDFESPWLYDVLWCFRTLASSICSVSWRAALKIACERKRKNACGKTWQNVIPPTYRPPTGIRNMTAGLWFSVGQLRSLAPFFALHYQNAWKRLWEHGKACMVFILSLLHIELAIFFLWPKVYHENSKSAPVTSPSCNGWGFCDIQNNQDRGINSL